jgi:hypothetical protein
MSYTYLQTKAQQVYNSAEKTYSQAIETRLAFEQFLDGIPIENKELYEQARAWHEEAVIAINAAWAAKHAAEKALEAVQGR